MTTENSNPTEGLARGSQVNEIANLFMEGEKELQKDEEAAKPKPGKKKQEPEETQELESDDETDEQSGEDEGEETPPDDSTESEEEVADDNDLDVTWASALGVSEDQLNFDDNGNLKGVNVKVNGEVTTLPIADLIKGYQTGKAVTQKATALAEERKRFDEESVQLRQQFSTKLEQADLMVNFLSNELVQEFNGIDWNALRTSDPAEYSALRHDYAARAKRIQEAETAIKAEKETTQKDEQKKQIEAHNAYVGQQRAKMLENNPEWHEQGRFESDMKKMKEFLGTKYGFQDNDFRFVTDARLIELIKDAMKFTAGKEVMDKKLKQKPVPKFLQSVGNKPKPTSKVDALVKKANKARGPQKRDLQSEAIAHLLTGEK